MSVDDLKRAKALHDYKKAGGTIKKGPPGIVPTDDATFSNRRSYHGSSKKKRWARREMNELHIDIESGEARPVRGVALSPSLQKRLR